MGMRYHVTVMIGAKYSDEDYYIGEKIEEIDGLDYVNPEENTDCYVGCILTSLNEEWDYDAQSENIEDLDLLKTKVSNLLSLHLSDSSPYVKLWIIPSME
jgi:vacuolar-type H+-ATPase subunit E/Vma4